jgi:hypothetical protein
MSGTRAWGLVVIVGVIMTCAVTVVGRAPPIMIPWDIILLLDGAWRITIGHIPHQDFHNPIGPLTYELIALGMQITGPRLASIAVATAVFQVCISAWTWAVARRRVPAYLAALFALYLGMLCVAPHPLGWDYRQTTYAMIYNRFGWALISVLFLQLFIPPSRQVSHRLEGLSIGGLLSLLFYLKVSYFLVALLGLGVALLLLERVRHSLGTQVVTILGLSGAWWLALNINPIAYLHDIAGAAQAQSLSFRLANLKRSFGANHIEIAFGVLFLLAAVVCIAKQDLRLAWRTALSVLFVGAATVIIVAGNAFERSHLPLLAVCVLCILHAIGQILSRSVSGVARGWGLEALFLVGLLLGIPLYSGKILLADVSSIVHTFRVRSFLEWHPDCCRIQSPALADFAVPNFARTEDCYEYASEFPATINDGLALLRQYKMPEERIFVMAFANPFSYALQSPPATGTPLWWGLNFSTQASQLPRPESLFASTDLVVVRQLMAPERGFCNQTLHALLDTYSPFLDSDFREVGSSRYWKLYRRFE